LRAHLPHLALVVAVVSFLGAAPAAGAAIPFTGTTDQGQPLTMTTTATGRKITLHFAYEVACASALAFRDVETVRAPGHPTIRRRRVTGVKFSAQGQGKIEASTADGQQVTGMLDVVVAGNVRLRTGNATGRIEATIALSNGDTCTTGTTPVRWTATIAATPPAKARR
jgi:hypothetical protein